MVNKFKLVIEIDGDSHFSEEARKYHKSRTQVFKKLGLEVSDIQIKKSWKIECECMKI